MTIVQGQGSGSDSGFISLCPSLAAEGQVVVEGIILCSLLNCLIIVLSKQILASAERGRS